MIEEMGGDFFQWLRGFFYVAKRGSMTLAALEMRRNQPTISHQIKCLENEFGISLFDRSKGKMELTPEGKIFLEKAISVFEIIKEMKNEIGENELQHRGDVIIATTHAIIHYFLPRFIVDFKGEHPDVNFGMEGGGLRSILGKLESAEANFGIANLDKVPEGLVSHDLFETGLKLIAPKDSAFFSGKRPTLNRISKAPFIIFPGSSTITTLIKRKFQEDGLELKEVLLLNNFESVKKYVAMGVGVSILDDYVLTEEDEDNVDIFSLDHIFKKRKYVLILRKRKYLPPAVKAFIHKIKPDIQLT